MGVEEELMLVDPETLGLRAVSHVALAAHLDGLVAPARSADALDGSDWSDGSDGSDGSDESDRESSLDQELFLQQLETGTEACLTTSELRRSLLSSRRAAAAAAAAASAALVAVGTPVLAIGEDQVTPKPRYQRIVQEFGQIGRQGSVCGTHVHVDVADDAEGVRVIDGLRPWLPVLRALSVNSPYWHGHDTGYASWRSQVWGRWPSAGPSDPFGDPEGYSAATDALIASGAALDAGMLYYDARLSRRYPTVEVRVFDAMTEPDDVLLLAMLTRALVTTVAEETSGGRRGASSPWRSEMLRAAHWRASRDGLSRDLLDPGTGGRRPARDVVGGLVAHVRAALEDSADLDEVTDSFERLLARGTGAARQRAAAERGGGLEPVVADLLTRFAASWA